VIHDGMPYDQLQGRGQGKGQGHGGPQVAKTADFKRYLLLQSPTESPRPIICMQSKD